MFSAFGVPFMMQNITPECRCGLEFLNRVRTRLLTFENHCLEEELTFGNPFQDSGVVGFRDDGFGFWLSLHDGQPAIPTVCLP